MKQKEIGVRMVHILGVPVSISSSRGGLIIWVNGDMRGKNFDLEHPSGYNRKGNVVAYAHGGREVFAAVFNRLEPGYYTVKGKKVGMFRQREQTEVQINSGLVEQIDWR